MKRSANIDAGGFFRYWLLREWDTHLARLIWVCFNPSTADGSVDDASIRKMVGFATRAGYGSIMVLNLFAYRARKPADLKSAGWLAGGSNPYWLNLLCHPGAPVVCAWGALARPAPAAAQARNVIALLRANGCHLLHIRLTDDGIPVHPLMQPYSLGLSPLPESTYR